MARRGRTSIVREVKESIDAIDRIGHSKRDARKSGQTGIHSKKQKENTLSDCQNFVKWCRSERGVKSISNLTQEHVKAYFEYMREKGLSEGHRLNVETSLRLLERGFRIRSERFSSSSLSKVRFCPEERLEKRTRGLDVRNRSYSDREIQLIREHVSPEVQKAVDLMRNVGLRVKGAANVRVEHFVPSGDGKGLCLKITNGSGITKGGRFRDVPIPKEFEGRLLEIIGNKQGDERLVNVTQSTIRDGVNAACKVTGIEQDGRGCHGFRHTYARSRMEQIMNGDQQAMMQRIIENCKIGRKADYGILADKDKALYLSTKEQMDRIHSELGHGKNRWELALRYMGD